MNLRQIKQMAKARTQVRLFPSPILVDPRREAPVVRSDLLFFVSVTADRKVKFSTANGWEIGPVSATDISHYASPAAFILRSQAVTHITYAEDPSDPANPRPYLNTEWYPTSPIQCPNCGAKLR